MSVHFYNTLTRRMEEFHSLEPGKVRFYSCGPTVYNYAHVGNYRAYVFEDLVHRYLEFSGFDVMQVMNLTDVDDKTIKGALEQKLSLKAYTRPYIEAFFADLKTLNITPADRYPAATDHIPEMIVLIEKLIAKGHAYQSDDKSVYYRIDSFPTYGCLACLDRAGMKAGARVAQDEYEKDNVGDFALWKAWDEKDGDIAWDSPWGRGRPGWHIECSAMSMKYLGETFDLHSGGVDNIFPHHDDEIAQSEAATGKQFVHTWLHCAHLVVDGKKMSKKLGNFFTLRDLLEKGYSGREIRYLLLSAHYRQTLNFTLDGLQGARTALTRLDEFRERLTVCAAAAVAGTLPVWATEGRKAFVAALDQDLNMSEGLAALFDLVRAGNKALDAKEVDAAGAAAVLVLWNELDRVLGVLQPAVEAVDPEVVGLVSQRQAARAAKNWKESDRLRDEIAKRGWVVQDTAQGQKLRRLG
jgi:cysteinyl-tRNA synthetase